MAVFFDLVNFTTDFPAHFAVVQVHLELVLGFDAFIGHGVFLLSFFWFKFTITAAPGIWTV